jgi:hypothetical protein
MEIEDVRTEADKHLKVNGFLETIFGASAGVLWLTEFRGDPKAGTGEHWKGHPHDPTHELNPNANWYYSVCELKPGALNRDGNNFQSLNVIVLDDVGEKVDAAKIPLAPSYRIETHEGSEQWGYILAEPLADKTKAKRLFDALRDSNYTDKGGQNLVRYVRLPGGTHGAHGFSVTLKEWEPARRYTLQQLCDALALTIEGQRGRPRNELPLLAPSVDSVMQWFEVLSDTPNTEGFFDVVCPWYEQHGGQDKGGTAYKPGGAFVCMHGSCADRHIADVIAARREQRLPTDDAIKQMPGPHGGLLRMMLRYLYATDIDRFVDRELATFHDVAAFDRMLAHEMPKYHPSRFLLERRDAIKVSATVYLPGQKELLTLNEVGRPMRACNLWRTGPIMPAETCDATRVRPWLDHLAWLFPDESERAIALDFLTHLVQKRGGKINWMLVAMCRVQGAGRDSLIKPIRNILGHRNVASISENDLFSDFNEWEAKELVCFSETRSTDGGAGRIYRTLKEKITTPPDTTSVNVKNLRLREMKKVANFLMLTNDPAAVAAERGDRRICVIETPHLESAVRVHQASGVFKTLHGLYASVEWMANFHRFLLDRAIGEDFDALGNAPRTEASARMAEAARSDLDVQIQTGIDERTPAIFRDDLIKVDAIMPQLTGTATSRRAVASALRQAGAIQLKPFRDDDNKVIESVWALRDVERYAAMSGQALRDEWRKCQRF